MAGSQDILDLLKKHGYTFYWNEADKHWWLTKNGNSGKVTRTDPVVAESREEALRAAADEYVKRSPR
jgi:hypothetical protein